MACSKKTPISFMCQQYRNSISPKGKGLESGGDPRLWGVTAVPWWHGRAEPGLGPLTSSTCPQGAAASNKGLAGTEAQMNHPNSGGPIPREAGSSCCSARFDLSFQLQFWGWTGRLFLSGHSSRGEMGSWGPRALGTLCSHPPLWGVRAGSSGCSPSVLLTCPAPPCPAHSALLPSSPSTHFVWGISECFISIWSPLVLRASQSPAPAVGESWSQAWQGFEVLYQHLLLSAPWRA